jgi:hypothetical protein
MGPFRSSKTEIRHEYGLTYWIMPGQRQVELKPCYDRHQISILEDS